MIGTPGFANILTIELRANDKQLQFGVVRHAISLFTSVHASPNRPVTPRK